MPVRHRRGYYGENPQQSQLPAGGQLIIPPSSNFILLGSATRLTYPLTTTPLLVEGSPKPGYNWEIVNLHVPLVFRVVMGFPKEKIPTTKIGWEILLNVNIGSQNLFVLKRVLIPTEVPFSPPGEHSSFFCNVLFTEVSPVPLILPFGQQLALTASLIGTNAEGEITSEVASYAWSKVGTKNSLGQEVFIGSESSINYKFV